MCADSYLPDDMKASLSQLESAEPCDAEEKQVIETATWAFDSFMAQYRTRRTSTNKQWGRIRR